MPSSRLLFLYLLLVAIPALGQLADTDSATRAKCAQSLGMSLPAEASQAMTPAKFPHCNSYRLYEGIGTAVDFAAARHCAWAERLATIDGLEPRYTKASVFGGSAMLTVLYANGEGVEKNLPLAIRFACESGWAPAEISSRVEDIQSRIDSPNAAHAKFDFCDATTSGFMMGFCSARTEEKHSLEREDQLAKLSKNWPSPQRILFAQLVKLEAEYAQAHSNGEIYLAGTARAMEEIDSESSLKDDFFEAIKVLDANNIPNTSTEEAIQADIELNRIYRKSLQATELHETEYGAIQPDGIRKTERAWLKYRDAWISFAKLRYSSVSHDSWLALLTRDRISILQDVSCMAGILDKPCDLDGPESDDHSPRPLP